MKARAVRAFTLICLLASTGLGQVTRRASVDSRGRQANDGSAWQSISGDGRYVAFISWANNLVPGDTNNTNDIFVRDTLLGTTVRASVNSAGEQANNYSQEPAISGDGKVVAFGSMASNLSPLSTSGYHVYARDLVHGTTELVDVGWTGQPASFGASSPSVSGDGRYVAFMSSASNLVSGDTNSIVDFFVRDRRNGTTECVSNPSGHQQYDDRWYLQLQISADGSCVAFTSYAKNLVPGVDNGLLHVFVRDRISGDLFCPIVGLGGDVGGREEWAPTISGDGRFVAFASQDNDLVSGDTNHQTDIFVCTRGGVGFMAERVSVNSGGVQGNGPSYSPSISADGRFVAFESEATNLVGGDTNQSPDVFVHDRLTGTTERVNLEPDGSQGHIGGYGMYPSISADGRFVAFDSSGNDLVGEDTNNNADVFVRDRAPVTFASLCDPGMSGVLQCPCQNPPSDRGRGCDNSARTGGAVLSVTGGACLSSDTITFVSTGETPNALSIVFQGTASSPRGAIYGQGVRCVGGTMRSLYLSAAQGDGTITIPHVIAGEQLVHDRSAAMGDLILAGTSRWYMVMYRDSIILGGCPAGSSFNVTQTRAVNWVP